MYLKKLKFTNEPEEGVHINFSILITNKHIIIVYINIIPIYVQIRSVLKC
jgi:hypothetical protein